MFFKSNKQVAGKNACVATTISSENDIMIVDNYVAVFRCYSDMTIYILGMIEDNELILGQVLECVHECFDSIFKHSIERKALINNMSGVILVIDELID